MSVIDNPPQSVWKFPLVTDGSVQEIEIPSGSRFLSFQNQHEQPVFWAQVIPSNPSVKRRFRLVATGEPFREDTDLFEYRGTAQFYGGNFVLHLFELRPQEVPA